MRCIGLLVGLLLVSVVGAEDRVAYSNTDLDGLEWDQGSGGWLAEDVQLEGGVCHATSVEVALMVAAGMESVELELWDGDPCDEASSPIPGTLVTAEGAIFDIQIDSLRGIRRFDFTKPVRVSDHVWVRVVFDSLFGAWLTVTPNAEVGTTSSTISSSDNTFFGTGDCGLVEPGQFCEWFALYAVIACENTECDEPKDTDGDGDIDLKDFAAFQRCFMGPG